MHQMQAILDRINARRAELDLSEGAVAMQGGSRDLIRNWRRALEKGQTISARYESLAAIARALHVSEDWLIHGKGKVAVTRPTATPPGVAESATPFTLNTFATRQDDPQATLRAIFGPTVATPALYRINIDHAAFGLASGDVVVVDLARLPAPGELCIASITDEETASAVHVVCRYAPPLLLSGQFGQTAAHFRVDDPGVTVRHPVAASIRGLPTT